MIECGDRLVGPGPGGLFLQVAGLDRGVAVRVQQLFDSRATFIGPGSLAGFYVVGATFYGEHAERARASAASAFPARAAWVRDSDRGPGNWPRRYAQFRPDEVFSQGLADPNLWSNSAATTEVGLSWYWNEYTKIYMFWLHGEFGDPVQYRPGGFQQNADMFWLELSALFLRISGVRWTFASSFAFPGE